VSGGRGSGICGRCGCEGPLGKVACAEHPDLCRRCYRAQLPRRRCGICGKIRTIRIRARDGRPDICDRCAAQPQAPCGVCGRVGPLMRAATATTPAEGRCCYRPPVAVCSACARQRPCVHADGPEPLCVSCAKVRRTVTCIACGHDRPGYRRVPDGVLCAACDRRRGGTTGACRDCRSVAPLVTRRCHGCRLRARLEQLAAEADPAAAATLAPYLAGLAAAANPASTLRWMQGPAFALLEDLLAGRVEVSHTAIDAAQGDASDARAVAFLRAGLVHHGALEPRDEPSAAFARWQQRNVNQLAPSPDRAHVRAYSSWQVAHQLAATSQRGRATPAAQKYARALVSEAIKLVGWLYAQQLALHDLRQDLVDTWIAAGTTTRRRVRMFLGWLARAGVTGALHVAWTTPGDGRGPLAEQRRFDAVRRLLHDRDVDARDRFAGLLLLLYAQPLTRTAALKTTDIAITPDGQITITVARGAVPLPEPLGSLAHALRYERLAATGADGWLLPGLKTGTHITAERLRERLKRYGITSRPSRHAALLALAARLPAPILAERLGFHQARAAQWARAAGATYSDYVGLRTAPGARHG